MSPGVAPGDEVDYPPRRMLRISWPLALLLAAVVAIVARKPRLVVPIAIVFVVWYVVQRASAGRKPER